ncbi:MAG: hypothetical protein E7019_06330 [Alphaproteobacteria bacterium]|nr:hypothetical protein [Alphaproteobacteria bacterium]
MQALRTLITQLGAFFVSLITRPLLGRVFSRYGLYVLNNFIACIITVVLVFNLSKLSDEQIANSILIASLVLCAIVKISEVIPQGQEHLKLWYDEASEEDDQEYFSKRDMRGKPWWKFMFIPGWITIIFFHFYAIVMWFIYYPKNWKGPIFFSILALVMTFIVIRNAKIRKRNYDNGYK